MNYKEYGKENTETVLLLHGGGLSWWNYREEAQLLQTDCHVVLPILDGHAGSDRPFSSIEENAAEIISFIDGRLGGSVALIGGLSLGGQILLEMLSQRGDICRYSLVESAAVIPSGVTHALVGPAFGGSYALVKNRSFAKLQFRSLRMKQDLFEDYYRDTCAIRKADMIAFMQASTDYALKDSVARTRAQVHVFAGEKETRTVLRSADAICEAVPGSSKTVLPGLYHGEFSLNCPQRYAQTVRGLLCSPENDPEK